jgi:NitT/TauT family transport system ATP-binding protein
MEDTHISVRDVCKRFSAAAGGTETIQALGPLSIDIRRGEFFSIVGPSGCGKSTLFEILAGLCIQSEGEVEVDGISVKGRVPDGIGAVFQEDATFPWLDVRSNIAFSLRHRDVPKDEVDRRVDAALELMNLRDFAKAYPAQLSGGMRQRVCIARTLVLQPSIILLDEPFGALDQQTRLLMGDELLRLWRATGATVLLITHSLDEAALLSDRIGVVSARPGRFLEIVETGWPANRDSRLAAESKFGTIQARLWSLLRSQSLKSLNGASR